MLAITLTLEPINCINAWIGVSFCINSHYKKLSKFQNILDVAFHAQANSDHLVSNRMTKAHVIFHDIVYLRKRIFLQLQLYLVEFNSNRMTLSASVTLYMKMWHVDDLNNATNLAEIYVNMVDRPTRLRSVLQFYSVLLSHRSSTTVSLETRNQLIIITVHLTTQLMVTFIRQLQLISVHCMLNPSLCVYFFFLFAGTALKISLFQGYLQPVNS